MGKINTGCVCLSAGLDLAPGVLTDHRGGTMTRHRELKDDGDFDNWTENVEDLQQDSVDECLFGL